MRFQEVTVQLFQLIQTIIMNRRKKKASIGKKVFVELDFKSASIVSMIIWWQKNGTEHNVEYVANQVSLYVLELINRLGSIISGT